MSKRLRGFIILLIVFITTSCAKMNAVKNSSENLFFEFNTDLTTDASCLSKDVFQACLFLKNPVHQTGAPFSEKINSSTDLGDFHTTGVEIITLNNSHRLENINVAVFPAKGSRVKKENDQWKFTYNENRQFFEQVSAYYWASYATAIIEDRTGRYWAKGKQIKVFTEDRYSGYSPSTNSVHLQASTSESALAINAGILMHYVGLANLYHATNGQIEDLSSDTDHKDCSKSGEQIRKKYCCNSALGCSKAIASGAADYFSAIMFPQAPTLGEAWTNSNEGLTACGLERDLRLLSEISSGQAFEQCQSQGLQGHHINMGSIYASIWWDVREKAKKEGSQFEVDTLYQNHLIKIDGSDNFKTVYQKILLTDRELYSGKFSADFKTEFEKRGIPIE